MSDKNKQAYRDFALSGRADANLRWFADNGFSYDSELSRWTCPAGVMKAGNKRRSRVTVVVYVLCDGNWLAACLERGMPMPGPTWAEGATPELAFDRLSRKMNGDDGTDNEGDSR